MSKYIDADALKLPSELPVDPYDEPYFRGMYAGWNNALKECRERIDSAPTISPDEARGVGKWIEDAMRIKCSACGTDFNDEVTCCSDCYRWPWNYCPNCGAKMKGVSKDV